MNETEWLELNECGGMLYVVMRKSDFSIRKLLLLSLACAIAERYRPVDPRSLRAMEVLDRFLHQLATSEELEKAMRSAWEAEYDNEGVGFGIACAASAAYAAENLSERATGAMSHCEASVAGDLLRDIFGNPFRPVTLDPRWLTSTVLDLARTIYDEFPQQAGGYVKMPILADALMDAGCDSEEIIKHCQGPGPHVRGCWVVDLLLGKQ